jgi:hypothetical protein
MPGVDSGAAIGGRPMTASGASCPFRLVLANVPSPNPQRPFAARRQPFGSGCKSHRRRFFASARLGRSDRRSAGYGVTAGAGVGSIFASSSLSRRTLGENR